MPTPFESDLARRRVAREVARTAGSFEHLLTGRVPTSVMIVADGDWMVVSLSEAFSPDERRLAAHGQEGLTMVRDFHRQLFDDSLDSLRRHVERRTGVMLRGAVAHVDSVTGSVLKTFTTSQAVDLFELGRAVLPLGVPIDTHVHADATSSREAV
jgi:uncharacterized protein YbcI